MRRRRSRLFAVTTVALVALALAAGCGDADDRSTSAPPPSTALSERQTFRGDVREANDALLNVLQTLAASELGDLEGKTTRLYSQVDVFESAIEDMKGYTLSDPTLEEQRSRLVQAGPQVSRTVRDFLDAVASGDASRAQRIRPLVHPRVRDFVTSSRAQP